jgi:hypothetical protein
VATGSIPVPPTIIFGVANDGNQFDVSVDWQAIAQQTPRGRWDTRKILQMPTV